MESLQSPELVFAHPPIHFLQSTLYFSVAEQGVFPEQTRENLHSYRENAQN